MFIGLSSNKIPLTVRILRLTALTSSFIVSLFLVYRLVDRRGWIPVLLRRHLMQQCSDTRAGIERAVIHEMQLRHDAHHDALAEQPAQKTTGLVQCLQSDVDVLLGVQ